MTHDEIMKLEAGRELDALVAEHVMGTPFAKPTHGPCCTCQTCGWSNEWECQCGYSDDIKKAWLVVEKLVSGQFGFYFKLDVIPSMPRDGHICWHAFFGSCFGFGKTPAMAICRAALLAVMDNRP